MQIFFIWNLSCSRSIVGPVLKNPKKMQLNWIGGHPCGLWSQGEGSYFSSHHQSLLLWSTEKGLISLVNNVSPFVKTDTVFWCMFISFFSLKTIALNFGKQCLDARGNSFLCSYHDFCFNFNLFLDLRRGWRSSEELVELDKFRGLPVAVVTFS